jgi:hypothetical protein
MENVITTLENFGFVYFGVYIDAFTNGDGKIEKRTILPTGWQTFAETSLNLIWDKNYGILREPNAVAVLTELSNISTIDVDRPDECAILDKLKKECKFYVKTRKGFHFYYKNNKDLERRKMCGVADINTQLLYICPEYQEFRYTSSQVVEYKNKKGGKSAVKKYTGYELFGDKYKYEMIKSDKLVEMSSEVVDWCKQLIMNNKTKVRNVAERKEKSFITDPNIEIKIFNIEQLRAIYEIFSNSIIFEEDKEKPFNLFSEFTTWRDIGYISRHLNNSEEAFKLFDEYSRKVVKYKNACEIDNRIAYYQNNKYEEQFEYGGVLHKCKKLNKKLFSECLLTLYSQNMFASTKIKTQYLFVEDNFKYFDDWIENKKVLMVKSPYGTGKTHAFKELIKKYDFKRVLFITYRQSLAWNLIIDLEKLGFKSYQDRKKEELDLKKEDKLIIQLDSIHLLRTKMNMFSKEAVYPQYDLVVMDEIEGILNHMSFSKINQLSIEHILRQILIKSTKILCLDGDLGNRSVDYIDSVFKNNYFILENKYISTKKEFIFTNDKELFEKKMDESIKAGKKIVVPSMIARECENIRIKYGEDKKVIVHTSIERNKKILMDVNNKWNTADILTYSPCVEAGVDFTVEQYFDDCFGILSNDSTSYRAFSQMLNRVRYLKNNTIWIYTGTFNFKEYDAIYTYNDVEEDMFLDVEKTPLVNILIHNKVEENNTRSYFIPCFLQMIKDKGYTFKYIEKEKDKKAEKKDEREINYNKKELILNSEDITQERLTQIMKNEAANIDNREDYYAKEKMLYKLRWHLEEINEEVLDNIYNKNHVLKNYLLTKIEKEDRDLKKFEYLKKSKFDKIDYMTEIMECVEDGVVNYDKINKIVNNKKFKTLFSKNKQNKKIESPKSVNSLLETYGYKISSKKKNKKVDKKVITTYNYFVEEIKIIQDYNKRIENEEADALELLKDVEGDEDNDIVEVGKI